MNQQLNKELKTLFEQRAATVVPGAFDTMTAKMITDEGYKAIYITGAGITNASLGLPDLGFIGLKDLTETLIAMRQVTNLPIIVDADTGFGNAVNVTYTVQVLELAGANGVQLEDQVHPKKCGHFDSKGVIETDEANAKISAAVEARKDSNFQIIARTDARDSLGLSAAIERAKGFVKMGADVTFVESPQSVDEIKEIADSLPVPQVINCVHGGKTPTIAQEELAKMGYGIALYANAALQSSMLAIQKTLRYLKKQQSLVGWENNLINFEERQRIVDKARFDDIEAKSASTKDRGKD